MPAAKKERAIFGVFAAGSIAHTAAKYLFAAAEQWPPVNGEYENRFTVSVASVVRERVDENGDVHRWGDRGAGFQGPVACSVAGSCGRPRAAGPAHERYAVDDSVHASCETIAHARASRLRLTVIRNLVPAPPRARA